MNLAKNEKVIREWDYADSKQGNLKTSSKLVVTNKRIISENADQYTTDRKEIPVAAVQSISTSNLHNSNLRAIVMIVGGILIALTGIILASQNEGVGSMMVPFLILGVILAIIGVGLLNRGAFTLLIYTSAMEAESLAMAVGKTNALAVAKKGGKLKVKISRDVVDEMLDTIGALIIDIQEGVYDEEEAAPAEDAE